MLSDLYANHERLIEVDDSIGRKIILWIKEMHFRE